MLPQEAWHQVNLTKGMQIFTEIPIESGKSNTLEGITFFPKKEIHWNELYHLNSQ